MAQFDADQVKQLVQNLIDGEQDLTAKQQANADAIKSAADSVAKAQSALGKAHHYYRNPHK